MNREILFRAKMWDGSKWVYGTFSYEEGGAPKIYELVWDENYHTYVPEEYDIIPETIGQYTGLTDRNGVKIFEGDIVHLYGDKDNKNTRLVDYNALVVFIDGGFCAIDGTPDEYAVRRYGFAMCELNCEVIGNIHDNPELLQTGDASKEDTP